MDKKIFIIQLIGILSIIIIHPAFAQTASGLTDLTGKAIGAGVAFGLAALGAGIAIGGGGAAAIATVGERPDRPEVRTFALIVVALGEAVAIYGIAMAVLILGSH
ncbi:MAG: V-type ATP synthase subunit K [Nitrososphaerota archaeon]|nr:V-type ATP synthase subunit K [Nitrososphaerota archaeon]MDG7048555.1 V-type ATP synthase subunit K [Nitrososphaerota archaeon]MDG7051085.1 V-type ATP synthase subunit K [Nitrososphaerota archaeon]